MTLKKCLLLLMSFILIVNSGCQSHEPKQQDLVRVKSVDDNNRKKVILLVIDSLMAEAIDKGIQQKVLPTFQYLIEHGYYFKNMVSSFPTMSVTIDSSLITGAYPDDHHVPGLTWYSTNEKKLINYGTGPMEVIKQGVDNVLVDALVNLNDKHLSTKAPTIYEELGQHGLKSGSINGLIYRGPVDHQLSLPLWMEGPTSLPENVSVKGPDFLALGALSNPLEGIKKLPDGITERMGLNNEFSVDTVNYLITENKLPDFLYVYLPDLDQKLHKKGPSNIEGVKKVDGQLKSIMQSFGSPEEALKQAVFIVVGDSGMTQILPAQENPVIELPSLLKDHKILRSGKSATNEVDIALAVNETMAYVYSLKGNSLRDIADSLKADPRIDIIAWTDKDWIYAVQGGTSEELRYKSNGKLADSYGQK